jgi:CRP/FNR family cyclic AMP-dependent transcriptional regulator
MLSIRFRIASGFDPMDLQKTQQVPVMQMLEKTPLWSGLGAKDLKSIVKLSKERKYDAGETIVQKGEGGIGFYLILEGSVEIRSEGSTLSKLGPTQFFGEMSVIDNQARSADVVAVEPTRCLILSAWSFNSLISQNPKIALKMLQELVRRLRSTDKALSD